jgi:hypothetical protein
MQDAKGRPYSADLVQLAATVALGDGAGLVGLPVVVTQVVTGSRDRLGTPLNAT